MSASGARRYPTVKAGSLDVHGDSSDARASGAEFAVSFESRPLPSDPKAQAEILAMVEAGMAEARAGRGVDADEVLARWDSLIAARTR